METKLDKFGRVLIPKNLRNELGLKPGETIRLELGNKEIIIRPQNGFERAVGNDKGLIFISDDFDEPLDEFNDYTS